MDFEANAKDGHGVGLADPLRRPGALVRSCRSASSAWRAPRKASPSFPTASSCRPSALERRRKGLRGPRSPRPFPGRKVIPGRCAHLSERSRIMRNWAEQLPGAARARAGLHRRAYHSSPGSSSLPAAERIGNLTPSSPTRSSTASSTTPRPASDGRAGDRLATPRKGAPTKPR